jgi:hypothetical protein
VSTSNIQQRQELAPRPYMSITEVLLGAAFLLGLFAVGPIGFHTHHWDDKAAALITAGGVVGGLVIWLVVHTFLVKTGLIRPIDQSLMYEQSNKAHGRR